MFSCSLILNYYSKWSSKYHRQPLGLGLRNGRESKSISWHFLSLGKLQFLLIFLSNVWTCQKIWKEKWFLVWMDGIAFPLIFKPLGITFFSSPIPWPSNIESNHFPFPTLRGLSSKCQAAKANDLSFWHFLVWSSWWLVPWWLVVIEALLQSYRAVDSWGVSNVCVDI